MGRLVAQLPNEDASRLGRVLDAKYRCIGVCPPPNVGAVTERCMIAKCPVSYVQKLPLLKWLGIFVP
jgi:hypothetical protein